MNERTEKLIGAKNMERLKRSNVLIVGLGGVGGCVFEMLVRCGVGNITVVDDDEFDETNLNRQILSNCDNIGKPKVYVAYSHGMAINKDINITAKYKTFDKHTVESILDAKYDIVVDCIDRVANKVFLIIACQDMGIECISAMSAGNRTEIDYAIGDIYETENDDLARAVRKELRHNGIESHKVVFSKVKSDIINEAKTITSISYVANALGCKVSEYVVKFLLEKKEKEEQEAEKLMKKKKRAGIKESLSEDKII